MAESELEFKQLDNDDVERKQSINSWTRLRCWALAGAVVGVGLTGLALMLTFIAKENRLACNYQDLHAPDYGCNFSMPGGTVPDDCGNSNAGILTGCNSTIIESLIETSYKYARPIAKNIILPKLYHFATGAVGGGVVGSAVGGLYNFFRSKKTPQAAPEALSPTRKSSPYSP